MKRKFRKILGVGMALALLTSMLVMAAPVAAADPVNGVEFKTRNGSTVTWTTEEGEVGSGTYSLKLTIPVGQNPGGSAAVKVFYGDALGTFSDDSFTFLEMNPADPGGIGGPHSAYRILYIDSTGGNEVNHTLVRAGIGAVLPTGTWTDSSTLSQPDTWFHTDYYTVETLSYWQSEFPDARVVYVGIGWATWIEGELRDEVIYIDDITINGVTYDLEPIFLDKAYYSVGDTVVVTVPNFGANTDPIRKNPVTGEGEESPTALPDWEVSVISDSDSEGITVDLEETGMNTGVFVGRFASTGTLPAAENELYVQDGDEITVTYAKEGDWGSGADASSSDLILTAEVDDTPPTITVTGLLVDGATTANRTPEISADYIDTPNVSDIDKDSVEIIFNGVDVTDDDATTTVGSYSVTYTPVDDLVDGSYDVTVNVSDNAGNVTTESWSFRVVSWLVDPEGPIESPLDALETVGVAVSITGADEALITVGHYASNPEPEAPLTFTTIENGFFDVKVEDADTATQIVIKFADANITADSTAYVWSELEGAWLECSDQGYNPTDEYLWVKVRTTTTPNIAELEGTPFAISGEVEVFDPLDAYDEDEDGVIQKTEAIDAIWDYFDNIITKDQAIEVLWLYFA